MSKKTGIIERVKRALTPKPQAVQTVQAGDVVTLNGGRKVGTDESRGTADLRGVRCVVVDTPTQRVGAVDVADGNGEARERVHVRPIMGDGTYGMPLDIPTERISEHDRRRSRSVSGWGDGTGAVREKRRRLGLIDGE